MKVAIKITTVLLLTTLYITGCANAPEATTKQPNSADSQRTNAKQAQDELKRETSR